MRLASAESKLLTVPITDYVRDVRRATHRRCLPYQHKETYTNKALRGRGHGTLYVEVGVSEGVSFRLARADQKIGIDPAWNPKIGAIRKQDRFFELTSDEFFRHEASHVLRLRTVDVALLDGFHEFRQTLSDLLHLEPYMRNDGIIVIDDMNPKTLERAADVYAGGAWNGDVWKLAPFLRDRRPDLHLVTVDADEGVGIVSNFGQRSAWPPDDVITTYKALPYDYLAAERASVLNLVAPTTARRLPWLA
jgi:hypothetical protein